MNRIEQLKKFIEEDATDQFSRYALGLEYLKNSDFAEAEKCFEFLISHHPQYIGTYYQFAKLLQLSGRNEEAKKILKSGMIVTKNSDFKTYAELQNELTNIELGLEE